MVDENDISIPINPENPDGEATESEFTDESQSVSEDPESEGAEPISHNDGASPLFLSSAEIKSYAAKGKLGLEIIKKQYMNLKTKFEREFSINNWVCNDPRKPVDKMSFKKFFYYCWELYEFKKYYKIVAGDLIQEYKNIFSRMESLNKLYELLDLTIYGIFETVLAKYLEQEETITSLRKQLEDVNTEKLNLLGRIENLELFRNEQKLKTEQTRQEIQIEDVKKKEDREIIKSEMLGKHFNDFPSIHEKEWDAFKEEKRKSIESTLGSKAKGLSFMIINFQNLNPSSWQIAAYAQVLLELKEKIETRFKPEHFPRIMNELVNLWLSSKSNISPP